MGAQVIDVSTLADDELNNLLANGAIERYKREQAAKVAEIPAQIEALAEEYTRATGEPLPPVDAAKRGADNGQAPEPTPTP